MQRDVSHYELVAGMELRESICIPYESLISCHLSMYDLVMAELHSRTFVYSRNASDQPPTVIMVQL